MRVVCAWCQREGRDGLLAEREPVEDTTETHTICARHAATLIAQLPSVTFPGIRVLFVVRRGETALFEHLTRLVANLPDVAVILDRRRSERRRATENVPTERRQASRRIRKAQFSPLGYFVVRFATDRQRRVTVEPQRDPQTRTDRRSDRPAARVPPAHRQ